MSTQSNKINASIMSKRGNLDALDEGVASDYVEHFPVPPGWPGIPLMG